MPTYSGPMPATPEHDERPTPTTQVAPRAAPRVAPGAAPHGPHHGASVLAFPKVTPPTSPDFVRTDLRSVIGEVVRDERTQQRRTLSDVAADAHVSVAYLSEVERGRKEVSSAVLDAITGALDLPLATVLERCVERLRAGSQRRADIQLRAA